MLQYDTFDETDDKHKVLCFYTRYQSVYTNIHTDNQEPVNGIHQQAAEYPK